MVPDQITATAEGNSMVQEEYSLLKENGLSEAALPDFPKPAVSFLSLDGSGTFRTNES